MNRENRPLVSVIVPCYNHEAYVTQTIESIVNQTYEPIELIVIDDGSRDQSPQLLEALRKKHHFTYEHQQNMGLAATLNKAITKYVTGKYLCICASDDLLEHDKIEKQVHFMEEHPSFGMCHGKCKTIDARARRLNRDKSLDWKSGYVFEEIFSHDMLLCAPSVMIRTDVLDDVGLYDPTLAIEDLYMWLKISKKYEIGFMDEYLASYRAHDCNASKDRKRMIAAAEQIFELWKEDELYEHAYAKWSITAFKYLAIDDKRASLKYAWKARKYFFNREYLKGIKNLILE
jgi:alpha-1,3-rhamnosyltransferase